MLSVFFLHLIISIVCLLSGFLFYARINNSTADNAYKPIIINLITGLIIISVLYQALILVFPLNYYCKLILGLLLAIFSFVSRNNIALYFQFLLQRFKNTRPLLIILITCAWFMVVLISAGPIIMDDTGSYHIQIIKWIQQYGTVPGLANLHERFGFNSAWFALDAVFTTSKPEHNYYSLLNGLLSVWLCVYLFTNLWISFESKEMSGNLQPGGILLLIFFALFCWPLIRGNAANANYDFITTAISLILFLEIWKKRISATITNDFAIELILWPAFLFTVRIINYPLLIVSIYTFIFLSRQKKRILLFKLSSICAILVLSFLIRNVIVSGYLFYPIYQIDLFSFDWKADLTTTKELTSFIKYFNRVNNGILPIEETQKYTGFTWIPLWFRYLLNYDKLIVITTFSGFSLWLLSFKKMRNYSSIVKIFVLSLILQLVSWFLIAPDPRFAYGPLLTGSYLLITPFEQYVQQLLTQKVRIIVFCLISITILSYSFIKITIDKDYRNPLVPALLPYPPVHKIVALNNTIKLREPGKISGNWNTRCYGTDLPCLYDIKPGLQARSNNIKDGFKIEK